MTKIDLKKELRYLYHSHTKVVSVIDAPPMNFLMIDGAGDPNTAQAYQEAIEALFSVSYALKFMIKKSDLAIDYGVMPLEGLWWAEDMARFSTDDKQHWLWTAMIMQPEYVTESLVAQAIADVTKKKGLPAAARLRFEMFHEGQSAQIMHIGPFSAEQPTVERLHQHIEKLGFRRAGKHHEIYLSDFRKASPEKLKTIIRQPMGELKS